MPRTLLLLLLTILLPACGGGGGGGGDNGGGGGGDDDDFVVESWITNRDFPVTLAFAPDGRLFVGHLASGVIAVFDDDGDFVNNFATLSVGDNGEQGLLGIAFHPDFDDNGYLYVYATNTSDVNQVLRLTEAGGVGTNLTVIVDDIPAGTAHNGGRIGFGEDGKLYVTVGENFDASLAQELPGWNGRVLRLNDDGSIPDDNPFDKDPTFAYGLRNPFGLAFHPDTGTPYVSENGPDCDDEINRLVAGGNYGWRPGYDCGDDHDGFVAPIESWDPPIAPTGITFYTSSSIPSLQDSLLVADFNFGRLRRLRLDENNEGQVSSNITVLTGERGRILDVVAGPDGNIYFSTTEDIYRIVPD